ncbi:MAG: hypothetical protein HYY24_07995 [Verrucomicrobia bacterium]|nr:hypothetical protein [Verrucomicrobiota bacterium]
MQVTVEIPERVAQELESARVGLSEIIQRGLAQPISTESALAQELIEFLGGGPGPREILAFRPCQDSVQRASELLDRNRDGTLTPDERAELDEIAAWNRVFALIKAQARLHLQAPS